MRRLALAGALLACAVLSTPAGAAPVSTSVKFTASDGVQLHAYVGGEDDLRARPLIVEFSPYGEGCCGSSFGPDYNRVLVHARGTGLSQGTWTAVGPRDQQDVSEFLAWACKQPWSNGHIGLYGFSASAIAIYNSLHLPLACVDAASLMAGTSNLYRDLLYPGGIFNIGPGIVVAFGVGIPIITNGFGRTSIGQPITSAPQSGLGFMQTITDINAHTLEDAYWYGHSQRPGPNRFPVLADTGFYDPESRGPFESFKLLRSLGAHLLVLGAHDGFPKGTGGPFPEYRRWFDHYVRGIDNGVDREPVVRLWLGDGGREELLAGHFTRVDAGDWPVPGTRWRRLYLDPARAGSANSLNDGSLNTNVPVGTAQQGYPDISSLATATDPHTTSTLAGIGASPDVSFNRLFSEVPSLTQMNTVEPVSLTYTSRPFSVDTDVVGPAALDVFAASTSPKADLHAVVADVWPDGRAFPIGQGRLRMSFPNVDRAASVTDSQGEIVQPYGVYSAEDAAPPAQTREYHVEFWPLGNRFKAGHRLRLYMVGTSGYQLPATPGVNLVSTGAVTASRLLVPVLPARSAVAGSCSNPTTPRSARVNGGRTTTLRATLTRGGSPVSGAVLRASGPGFARGATTNAAGEAVFSVRPTATGTAVVRSSLCGGTLTLRVTQPPPARTSHRAAAAAVGTTANDGGGGSLPFTGLALGGILLAGAIAAAGGLLLRRVTRREAT